MAESQLRYHLSRKKAREKVPIMKVRGEMGGNIGWKEEKECSVKSSRGRSEANT